LVGSPSATRAGAPAHREGVGAPWQQLCLRLRGGKAKYKDLKVVKEAREEGLRVKGEHRPAKPKHRAGSKFKERAAAAGPAGAADKRVNPAGAGAGVPGGSQRKAPEKKVRGGKRAGKKQGADNDTVEADALAASKDAKLQDRMGMDKWEAKGENIFYGGEVDPDDSVRRSPPTRACNDVTHATAQPITPRHHPFTVQCVLHYCIPCYTHTCASSCQFCSSSGGVPLATG